MKIDAETRLEVAKQDRGAASANMVEAREWCDRAAAEESAATKALIEACRAHAPTTGRIMDLITTAVHLHLGLVVDGIFQTFATMDSRERLAFDLFLVRMDHAQAYQAGTVEERFRNVVLRHAELEMRRRDALQAAEEAQWAEADAKEGF